MNDQNNEVLLYHKLKTITKDYNILEKQLRQSRRDYGDSLLLQKETADELAEVKAKLHSLTSENETATQDLRLKLKMLKHRCKGANEEFQEMRKKVKTAAALEAENFVLKGAVEAAKAEAEKAVKEKEVVIQLNKKLESDKDIIMDCATTKFKAFDKRLVVLEAVVANVNLPSHSSPGQAAPVSFQETTTEPVIVYLDSD